MLRHSRAQTYIENKKHKEKDKRHTSKIHRYDAWMEDFHLRSLKKRYRFNLRDYLKSWGM